MRCRHREALASGSVGAGHVVEELHVVDCCALARLFDQKHCTGRSRISVQAKEVLQTASPMMNRASPIVLQSIMDAK